MKEGDIRIEVYRDGWTGALQISIGDGRTGYRIAGPKFNGSGECLLSKKLDSRDVKEIREYLKSLTMPARTAADCAEMCEHGVLYLYQCDECNKSFIR